ncbi:glycosyltransferase family 4 protein [Flavobacterium sp. NRK1]|uniref:glycosyltransferase family 4 protein n=1 Tax=Flavobacterium sp. NRK1 TaxID=2954929 RepID=UPI002092E035|nr:glycosyltransferase family 4 protein [Flavobacterium sp. NRK1]MCO6146883.1 glycosyltransferase family 4 protein [Flavobacterium sp. NRK1]
MKILLITQYFFPENFKSNDIAFELSKRGHEVTVLTGLPNYPEGRVYTGYGFFKNRKQNINGVKVIRSLLIPRGKGGGIRLFLNYFSWAFFASFSALKLALTEKFDAIIVHEPSPITQGFPAIVVKKLKKIPIYFWVLDLWPESLSSAGGINNKYILNFFKAVVQYIYNNSDKILISSKGFRKSIEEKGDYHDKIVYFPNWAEDVISGGNENYPIPSLPPGFKIIFAGNIGMSQDMESILGAALELKSKIDIKFIFLGDGRSRPYVEEFVAQNGLEKTVFLLGKYPVEAMASFFSEADGLLVSLRNELNFNLTVPAKMQAYMSSGKPILAMLNGEGAELVKEAGCGLAASASNYMQLVENILILYNMSETERRVMGQRGFNYYQQYFKLEKCMDNLEDILNKKI